MGGMTITLQIGNSDDKLTQERWAQFVECCQDAVQRFCKAVHFFAASEGSKRWQNAVWVVEIDCAGAFMLQKAIIKIRSDYNQDSAAWTIGHTLFI